MYVPQRSLQMTPAIASPSSALRPSQLRLGDLVPGRLGIAGRRLPGQRGAAGGTGLGDVIDDGVDPLRGQSAAERSRVAGLSAPPAPGPGLDDRLGGTRGIGRGRDRGIGGVPIEPEPEFVDDRLRLGDPLQRGVELPAQSLTLGASGCRGGLLVTHKPGRYANRPAGARSSKGDRLSRHWTVTGDIYRTSR